MIFAVPMPRIYVPFWVVRDLPHSRYSSHLRRGMGRKPEMIRSFQKGETPVEQMLRAESGCKVTFPARRIPSGLNGPESRGAAF